jgi:hypothetical protein
MRKFALGLLLVSSSLPVFAQASSWGALDEIAKREWTTANEPRPRVTKFHWVEPGRVLEARHGFVSRLQFGEDKFADPVERFVLDPKTGNIAVTYSYEDGRPALKAVMKVEADGSLVETFTDAKGVKKRNIYKSPQESVNLIERQELHGTEWTTLGTTRKAGLTQFEIAENARRAEEARQAQIAQENARRAAAAEAQRQAQLAQQRAEREAEYEREQEQAQQQAMQQSMPNPLQVLQGMAAAIQQGGSSYSSGGSGGGYSSGYSGGSGGGYSGGYSGGASGGYSGTSNGGYSAGSSGGDSGGAIIVDTVNYAAPVNAPPPSDTASNQAAPSSPSTTEYTPPAYSIFDSCEKRVGPNTWCDKDGVLRLKADAPAASATPQ